MANIKFSAFDATDPVSATIDLVAAKSGNNIRFTPADLAPFTGIYAANGTIGTTRKALITDTIQFRNAGDTSDIFIMNTDGTFALGDGATSLTNTNVVIGKNAKDNNVSSANSVIIGSNAQLYNAASQHSAIAIGESANARLYGVAIGRYSTHYGTTATTVGYSAFSGPKGVAIGYNSGVAGGTTSDVINIGYDAGSTGANSIVLNVSGSGASPATANTFGVYMTSNTTPDFEVVGNGESTLNTPKFKITGQAYTELYTNTTNLVVDWDDGNVQTVEISASSPQFTPTRAAAGATYILMITQGATPTTIDWDGTVKWSGGAPTLSSTTGQVDVITLICYNATANAGSGAYYGSASLNLVI